jgi:hypothetical protein
MYRVYEAVPGSKAFDTTSHITPEDARHLKAAGFDVALLYAEMLSAEDLVNCTAAGMGVAFTIEGLSETTTPSAELGARMARSAIDRVRSMGVPVGATYSADLEGDHRAWDEWIAFANAAAGVINAGADLSCGYIGEGMGLTSAELYALGVHRYWRGMSRVVDRSGFLAEPQCGWCMVQQYPTVRVGSLEVDASLIGRDFRDRTITVVIAAAP